MHTTKLKLCHECEKKLQQNNEPIIVYCIDSGPLGSHMSLAGCLHAKEGQDDLS